MLEMLDNMRSRIATLYESYAWKSIDRIGELRYPHQVGRKLRLIDFAVHLDQHLIVERNARDTSSRIQYRVKALGELMRDAQVEQVMMIAWAANLRAGARDDRFAGTNLARNFLCHLIPARGRDNNSIAHCQRSAQR